MTTRTFHKYTIVYEVLSEDPLPGDACMEEIAHTCTGGDNSGDIKSFDHANINGVEAAQLLIDQRSDPDWFRLDEDGNDTED